MSRADEFRRLLLHASERLAEEDGQVRRKFAIAHEAGLAELEGYKRLKGTSEAMLGLASYTAAVTYARLVMDTVAAFLVDDVEPDLPATHGEQP